MVGAFWLRARPDGRGRGRPRGGCGAASGPTPDGGGGGAPDAAPPDALACASRRG